MSDFTPLVDLAAARLGGRVLWANDDFFAEKENLLKAGSAVFREHEYTDRGKWMDGWETRRRRTPGHDSCLVQLGVPGVLRGVDVDTSFFRGNYPEACSLEACAVDGEPTVERLGDPATPWVEVLPRTPLRGDAHNLFALDSPWRYTQLRFHIYPDGGVARLRVHGEALPDWGALRARAGEVDLLSVDHGGRVVAASDMFFSAPQNLLLPGRGADMGDGWETKRRRGPGFDWVVLRPGIAGSARRVEVDTAHFKGNYPESCALEGCVAGQAAGDDWQALPWRELLPRTPLQPNSRHEFAVAAAASDPPVDLVRFSIFPDGGVSRLRLWGVPDREALVAAGLRHLNALPPPLARAALLACCGSSRWAGALAVRRPFASAEQLLAAAEAIATELEREDWLEAFARHPQIGDRPPATLAGTLSSAWSVQEQVGARDAGREARAALAEANRSYRERFGYIFIVCASGRSGEEMLALCRQRLGNDPERELTVAAGEQRLIARLRLQKLLAP